MFLVAGAEGSTGGSGRPALAAQSSDGQTPHTKRQSTKCCACDIAKYEMTFVGNWSRETHPNRFPPPQSGKW